MEIENAIKLLKHPSIETALPGTWADFGCGAGLFTNALASFLYPGSKIYAVDKNIREFQNAMYPHQVEINLLESDFTSVELGLKKLSGILMANSLHFIPNKKAFLNTLVPMFADNRRLLIVEYDMDQPNRWVPYPVSYQTLHKLLGAVGYTFIEKIHALPSRYNASEIYSVIATG